MAIQTLYPNNQTRRTVLTAVAAQTHVIGWVLRGDGSGVIWHQFTSNGATVWSTAAYTSVAAKVAALDANGIVVQGGNTGMAATLGINSSTYQNMLADDYAQAQTFKPCMSTDVPLGIVAN